ncbi:hypothetical protein TNCV_949221 [Trichonephila clavipes]|nr:hypothetical protein TNCV_949221 [Trichonephila clavipes]
MHSIPISLPPTLNDTENRAQWSSGSVSRFHTTGSGSVPETDQLFGTSAQAPQRPMVTYTGMDRVGPGPHGLLRHYFEISVPRTTTSSSNSSTYTSEYCIEKRLDGMYRYRCPCSFDTMTQLISRSDWCMVTSQSL